MKGRHDIRHLDAGVVDVVLHLDPFAERAQHAHERIAERGVAQVADVRGLVGIDVGVLDDDLLAGGRAASSAWFSSAAPYRARSKRTLI